MNSPRPITPQATSSMVLRRNQRGHLLWGAAGTGEDGSV
jgi:hypothetical protein